MAMLHKDLTEEHLNMMNRLLMGSGSVNKIGLNSQQVEQKTGKSVTSFITFDLSCCFFLGANAVGQPWARLEQPHPHPGSGDIYMEPAHHHGEHMDR